MDVPDEDEMILDANIRDAFRRDESRKLEKENKSLKAEIKDLRKKLWDLADEFVYKTRYGKRRCFVCRSNPIDVYGGRNDIFEHGKIQYDESIGYFLMDSGGFVTVLEHSISLGKCTCCGQETFLVYGGNIIMERCISDDKSNVVTRCSLNHATCPGMSKCINKDKIDDGRMEENVAILEGLVEKMIELYGVVAIYKSTLSKILISRYLLDESWKITMDYAVDYSDKEQPNLHFFLLSKDDAILKSRDRLKLEGNVNESNDND